MLVTLTYCSQRVSGFGEDFYETCTHFSQKNKELRLTGCLFMLGDVFVQTLEGKSRIVNDMYNQLLKDERHTNLLLLDYRQVSKRRFSEWMFVHQVSTAMVQPLLFSFSTDDFLDLENMPLESTISFIDHIYASIKMQKRLDDKIRFRREEQSQEV